ncbi:MAG TPA: glycosyltransferase [Segetibacter sp.]|jgi:glycosyltransferase involved in cell wall biosynthesis
MKLGIISDCIHYKTADGKIGTENHILLRQLQALCSFYTATLICCPFKEYDTSKVISFYSDTTIRFTPVPVVGGDSFKAKIKLITAFPSWWGAYKKINAFSDIIYQRFPNNLNIPAFFYFFLKKKKVFATYTGTWKNYPTEPFTYRFQRWLLRKFFRGPVWVYSDSLTDNNKIFPGFSPSYSELEWNEEIEQVKSRIERIRNAGLPVFKLITVGTLIDYKNQTGIVKSCLILKNQGFPFSLTIVGDGPMWNELATLLKELDLQQEVKMVGKKQFGELRQLYREHDFVVQAPFSEGFGKVPVEGFFHGVIPVINNISMAGFMTGNGDRGFLFDASDDTNLAKTLLDIKNKVFELPDMIIKGRMFAYKQTLQVWAQEYYNTVTNYFE